MMSNSIENNLQQVASHLENDLISSKRFSQICKIANLLSNFPTISNAGFECHLGLSTPRTDFFVSFAALFQNRQILVDRSEALAGKLSSANSVWHKIHDFSTQWANSKSSLYENIEEIWLEFDLDTESSEILEPSLFFCPKQPKKKKKGLSSYDKNNNNSQLKWISDEALILLLNNSLKKELKYKLLSCFQSLPYDAEVFQIGVMLPRKSESKAIRLCVENIDINDIFKYLSNLGWSDSSNEFSIFLSELLEVVDFVNLNFTVGDIISPKIGLECYLYNQPKNSQKWKIFQDYLIKNKLCTLDEANAIYNWSGYSENKYSPKFCKDNLATAYTSDSLYSKSVIGRLLSHIKIVYQPNKPLQAKAYLLFVERWLSQNGSFQKAA